MLENLQEKLPFMQTSVIVAMVMLLKAHLKTLYGLSEECVSPRCLILVCVLTWPTVCSKCSKFSLTRKSATGDKPAVKKHDKPISWDRLPFATKPLLTSKNVREQKDRVSC